MKNWRTMKCWDCSGHGLVSKYTACGDDFLGADECSTCGGTGRLFYSKTGTIVLYPGGPFRGRLTKQELKSKVAA